MSGTFAAPQFWSGYNSIEVGKAFAKELGINYQDSESILKQLLKKK